MEYDNEFHFGGVSYSLEETNRRRPHKCFYVMEYGMRVQVVHGRYAGYGLIDGEGSSSSITRNEKEKSQMLSFVRLQWRRLALYC